jgi:hypothetical protein
VLLTLAAACGGGSHAAIDDDAGTTPPPPPAGDGGLDATVPPGDASGGDAADATPPDSGPGKDSGPGPTGWDGGFPGPLTCANPGTFLNNGSGCGAERWTLKTGTDTAAAGISLLPKLTTIQDLQAITGPTTFPATTRIAPTEKTVFALKDVHLAYARLESDSDYHLMLSDLVRTIITEIPFPTEGNNGGCTTGSTWQCLIQRARANVDAQNFNLQPGVGRNFNQIVSVIGVGFFDPEHGQYGAAPNTIELHPLLGICFGAGCDPSK